MTRGVKWAIAFLVIAVIGGLAYLFHPEFIAKEPQVNLQKPKAQMGAFENGMPVGFRGPSAPPSMKGPDAPPPY